MDWKLELVAVPVGDVQDFPWGRFVFFAGPDGNRWAVQQLLARDGAARRGRTPHPGHRRGRPATPGV
jgi:hypothetical protein